MLVRYRMSTALVAVGVALGLATPAAAATAPTISAPAFGLGFGDIRISGTARAGATVTLIEAAYIFRSDMKPAVNYSTGGTLTTTANSTGHYTIARTLDSGFVFAVEADGLRSTTIDVGLRLAPELSVSSTAAGSLTVGVAANLAQAGLPVHIQRSGTGGSWTTLRSGSTDGNGAYSAVIAGQSVGTTEHIRAYLEENLARPTGYADGPDNVWSNWTDTMSLVIGSAGAAKRTPATTAPAAPNGKPTTPTPKPSPKPSTGPSTGHKAGDVQFSKIQFNSVGRDSGSNGSLNGEWFQLTNRTGRTIDLKSWTVRDAGGHAYTFGSYSVRAGRTAYVHTGRGTNGRPQAHRYWGRSGYVWNNGGDTATLRSNAGKLIDSCRYTGSSKGYTYC